MKSENLIVFTDFAIVNKRILTIINIVSQLVDGISLKISSIFCDGVKLQSIN